MLLWEFMRVGQVGIQGAIPRAELIDDLRANRW